MAKWRLLLQIAGKVLASKWVLPIAKMSRMFFWGNINSKWLNIYSQLSDVLPMKVHTDFNSMVDKPPTD